MLKFERFLNELMTSNCYIVVDEVSKSCVVIDPGSERSEREIAYIKSKGLKAGYIIITHEHTDHNWGVNALRETFPNIQLVCSEECSKHVAKANKAYFLLYYDDPIYSYEIEPADILINQEDQTLSWNNHTIRFVITPGHSYGSMCIDIDGKLFTGDTIMPFKPYFNGRDSNKDQWIESVKKVLSIYSPSTHIYPGHGDDILLDNWKNQYNII